jgi:CHAT domain-containing protein/tetratricopeptide (TPR) repeat protein
LLQQYTNDSLFSEGASLLKKFNYLDKQESVYYAVFDFYETGKNYQQALEILKNWNKAFPYSAWCLDNTAYIYNQLKDYRQSIHTIQRSLALEGIGMWRINQILSIYEASRKSVDPLFIVDSLCQVFPDTEDCWEKYFSIASTRTNFYKLCLEHMKNPVAAISAVDAIIMRTNTTNFTESKVLYDSMMKVFPTMPTANLRLQKLRVVANMWSNMGYYITLDSEVQSAAISAWHAYLKAYGPKGQCSNQLGELYRQQGNVDSASKYHLLAIIYNPNNKLYHDQIWQALSHPKKVAIYRKFCERNPDDPARWGSYTHFNNKWHGSSIEAIRAANYFMETFPTVESGVPTERTSAYSDFGDNLPYFETYRGDRIISASERYISWYRGAGNAVRKGFNTVVLDSANCAVKIYFKDGGEAYYADDCHCGKVKRLQVGQAFVDFRYNDDCEIVSIKASDGYSLEIRYNQATGRIKEMNSGNKRLQVEHYASGKIKQLILNRDTVRLFDDPDNSIDKERNFSRSVVLQIARVYEDLLEKAGLPEKALSYIRSAKLPELGMKDTVLVNLDKNFERLPMGSSSWMNQGIRLARYYLSHINDNTSHGLNSCLTSNEVYRASRSNAKHARISLAAIDIFYNALMNIRKRGVDVDTWNMWTEMIQWLKLARTSREVDIETQKVALAAYDKYMQKPVVLLQESFWLSKSDLKNKGFWKDHLLEDAIPSPEKTTIDCRDLAYDEKERLYVATDKGIALKDKGAWSFYRFDMQKQQFYRATVLTPWQTPDNFYSILFLNDSSMAFATDRGLLISNGNFPNVKIKRLTVETGLPSNQINKIAKYGSKLFVATNRGLAVVTPGTYEESPQILKLYFTGQNINEIQVQQSDDSTILLAATNNQHIYKSTITETSNGPPAFEKVFEGHFEKVFLDPHFNIYFSVADKVYKLETSLGSSGNLAPMELNGNITTTEVRKLYGFATIPVSVDATGLGVLTDRGISIYHNNHFEHLDIPNNEKNFQPAITLGKSLSGSIAIATRDRICEYERGKTEYYTGKIYDLLTLDSLNKTIIADGTDLKYYDAATRTFEDLSSYESNTTALCKYSDTSFLANSGMDIYLYTGNILNNRLKETFLFSCEPSLSDDPQIKKLCYDLTDPAFVNNIIKDKKGNIWVSTKTALFRFNLPDSSVDEFNFFADPNRFPSYTEMVSKVFETLDGRVLVVCSNEGHLDYKGVILEGGLLQWNPKTDKFYRLEVKDNYEQRGFNWFLTSYTQIDSIQAICGSLGGFSLETQNVLTDFDFDEKGARINSSYLDLKKRHPSLFLGSNGIRLDDLWLFGCAEGVVAYQNGYWFYPERFNQLLPKDQEFGQYGGRTVNVMSVDKQGNIFAGTEVGLLVYKNESEKPLAFLIDNTQNDNFLTYYNQKLLNRDRGLFLNNIDEATKAGKLYNEFRHVSDTIKNVLKLQMANQESHLYGRRPRGSSQGEQVNNDSLKHVHNDLVVRQAGILLRMEQEEPALSQLVNVRPVDIAASRKKLSNQECIIQYIPLPNRLLIQFISNSRPAMKEENIALADLRDSIAKLRHYLVDSFKLDNRKQYERLLKWLYAKLILPVEKEIINYKNIYIIPANCIYYVPFGSLMTDAPDGQSKYLVQNFNIGYIPSIYLFDLAYSIKTKSADITYMFGDPDNSLPHARTEIDEIKKLWSKCEAYVGKDATIARLRSISPTCLMLHLATHGYFDTKAVEKSWIKFADGNLKMTDIFGLDLDHVETAVLSACESGIGTEGIEYSTLATAFSGAGVPSILSTQWKVNDAVSKEILIGFYKYLKSGFNKFEALAKSQRDFIEKNAKDIKGFPIYWAPFIMLGKP